MVGAESEGRSGVVARGQAISQSQGAGVQREELLWSLQRVGQGPAGSGSGAAGNMECTEQLLCCWSYRGSLVT